MSNPSELNRNELRDFPLPRLTDTDKDEHGRLLICAGSRDVPGSAILSVNAAFRAGAGKVQLITAQSIAPAIALLIPELLAIGSKEAEDGDIASSALEMIRNRGEKADAILAGPGMRPSESLESMVRALLETGRPLVLDAATLHVLSAVAAETCQTSATPPVLLPHSGEMAALLDRSESEVDQDPLSAAIDAARRYKALVLAKGSTSFIASPDERTWVWRGGVAGLGVAGSGDVLAGIVAALLARGAEPLTALLWGVLLHGEAGEQLSKTIGPIGFRASEIPDRIPALLDCQ